MTYSPKTAKNIKPVTDEQQEKLDRVPWPDAVKRVAVDAEGRVRWEYA